MPYSQSLCTNSIQILCWSRTLHYIIHTFLHPTIVLFSQHKSVKNLQFLLARLNTALWCSCSTICWRLSCNRQLAQLIRGYSIIETRCTFTVKPISDSLGKSNGLSAVNNVICGKQPRVLPHEKVSTEPKWFKTRQSKDINEIRSQVPSKLTMWHHLYWL